MELFGAPTAGKVVTVIFACLLSTFLYLGADHRAEAVGSLGSRRVKIILLVLLMW